MSSSSASPSVISVSPEVSWLTRTILDIFSEEDIKLSIRIACQTYENLDQAYYRRVRESHYYEKLTWGTIGDLIVFLRGFQNKSACGYAHETRIRVGDIVLTPESCPQKHLYSGCGHPELNGLLLAEVLSTMLLDKAHPVRKKVVKIGFPLFQSLSLLDTAGALFYQKEAESNWLQRFIPISWPIQDIQEGFGQISKDELMHLAKSIEAAYK